MSRTTVPTPRRTAISAPMPFAQTEIDDAAADRARHRRDRYPVALRVDPGFDQEPAQPHLDPGGRTDAPALDDADVAASGGEIGMHDEKPVHALSLGAEQLCTPPLGKGGERRMRRA